MIVSNTKMVGRSSIQRLGKSLRVFRDGGRIRVVIVIKSDFW